MKCPIDDSELQMTERQGVEIDYCTKCRGIWLDRGELDKIIDRMQGSSPTSTTDAPLMSPPRNQKQYPQQSYGKHGRRKGLLGELFDF